MTVAVYRSTSSPPVLTDAPGTLSNGSTGVLDYVLGLQGWTITSVGTNITVYQQPVGSNGFYMYVDDSTTLQATVRGYETYNFLTNVGGNPFPDPNFQNIAGTVCYIRKSNIIAGGARNWTVVTNGKRFYLWIQTNIGSEITTPGVGVCGVYAFGDFVTYKPTSDPYCTLIQMGITTGVASSVPCNESDFIGGAGLAGTFAVREFTGIGSSIPFGAASSDPLFISDGNSNFVNYFNNRHYSGGGGVAYPYPLTNGLILTQPLVIRRFSNNRITWGYVPGVWWVAHSVAALISGGAAPHGDTFSGTGVLAGKTFEMFNFGPAPAGVVAFETSNTW